VQPLSKLLLLSFVTTVSDTPTIFVSVNYTGHTRIYSVRKHIKYIVAIHFTYGIRDLIKWNRKNVFTFVLNQSYYFLINKTWCPTGSIEGWHVVSVNSAKFVCVYRSPLCASRCGFSTKQQRGADSSACGWQVEAVGNVVGTRTASYWH